MKLISQSHQIINHDIYSNVIDDNEIYSKVIDSLDVKSRKIFPGMFILLNLGYWGYYWGYSRD